MTFKRVSIGTDPEFFCFDVATNKYISLIGKIGGTKDKPQSFEEEGLTSCGKLEDNVAAEFTTPPCQTLDDLYIFIENCRKVTERYLQKAYNPNYHLVPHSSAYFENSELEMDGARVFGCSESKSLYKGVVERDASKAGNYRSAGFHLHFGFNRPLEDEDMFNVVFLCDLFLGIPSIIYDKDTKRRSIYGNLGDYREKPKYPGLEYRVMGIGMYEHKNIIQEGLNRIDHCVKLQYEQHNYIINELKSRFLDIIQDIDNEITTISKLKIRQIYADIQATYLSLRNA